MPHHDGLLAIRTGRDDVDWNRAQLLDAPQVIACGLRQALVVLDADGALLPPRQLVVHRHAALELLRTDRQDVGELAVDRVAGADLHRLDAIEDIELGDANAGDAVQLDRALERRGVEPAGAPRPTGGRPELLTALAQPLADVVGQLGRKWPATHSRAVSLGDAQDVVQVHRPDAGAGGGGAR